MALGPHELEGFSDFGYTHRPLSNSFWGLPDRIRNINHKKELLRGLWVVLRKNPRFRASWCNLGLWACGSWSRADWTTKPQTSA